MAQNFDLALLSTTELDRLREAVRDELLLRQKGTPAPARCPACNGLGKVEDEYCECSMGLDLERIESRKGVMMHPDKGYQIPDEEWRGWEDGGMYLYPDDEYAAQRQEIAREKRPRRENLERIE